MPVKNYNPGIIIQARLTSERFPNKMLCPLLGRPVLEWVLDSARKTKLPIVVAIPDDWKNYGLLYYLKELTNRRTELKIKTFRGHKTDLISRFLDANSQVKFDPIVRICGDSPFFAPEDVELALKVYKERGYMTRINQVQVFSQEELVTANSYDNIPESREHAGTRFMEHTVDYPADIIRLQNAWDDNWPTMKAKKRLWGIT